MTTTFTENEQISFLKIFYQEKDAIPLKSAKINEAEDAQKSKIELGREVQIQNQPKEKQKRQQKNNEKEAGCYQQLRIIRADKNKNFLEID